MLTSKLIFFSKYNSSRRLVSLLWMALKSPTLPFRWNAFSSPCKIAVQPMERKTRLLLRSFNAKNDNHRHHCRCSSSSSSNSFSFCFFVRLRFLCGSLGGSTPIAHQTNIHGNKWKRYASSGHSNLPSPCVDTFTTFISVTKI